MKDTPELDLSLAPDATAPARARDAVAGLAGSMPPSVHADLRLLITEVVTNSVRHAGLQPGDRIHVRVRVLADRVTASCTDAGPGYAAPAHGAPHDPAEGWGLYLVDTLADRWGTDHGEVVRTWFELDLDV